MAKIRQRKGKWFFDVMIKGKRYRKVTGRNRKLAELALSDFQLKAERDQLGFLERKEISPRKFFEEYQHYSAANHRTQTQARYRAVIQHFLRFLDNTGDNMASLKLLKLEHFEKYKIFRRTENVPRNGLYDSKKDVVRTGAKAYTVNFELKCLRTIFYHAINWGYLESNPTKGMTFLKTDDSKQRRFLTEDECRRLLAAADPKHRLIIGAYMATGMRKAELVNLEWSDIDFEQKTLRIQRKAFWVPKAGERTIPLVEGLLNALNGLPRTSNFVFVDKKGRQFNPNRIRHIVIKAAKIAGIKDLTEVHALRHTFASQLIMKGVDLPSVQKLLGHQKIETTMIYTHQTTQHLRDAIAKLPF